MTFDLNQYQREVQIGLQNFVRSFPVLGQKIGTNARALIEQRIVSRGLDNRGRPFSGYSDKPFPTYLNYNRMSSGGYERLVSKAKSRKKQRGGLYSSYKEVREADGRQTKFKDFRYTGEMWRNIAARTNVNRNGFATVIAGRSKLTKDKLEGHSDREGQDRILNVSKEEEKQLAAVVDAELQKAFRRVR